MDEKRSVSLLYMRIAALAVAVAAFILSLFFFFRGHDKDRRLMYFPSYDRDGIYSEARYIRKAGELSLGMIVDEEQYAVSAFVDDLLLGPMTNRYERIFPRGTKAEYCFTAKNSAGENVLYLGLSRDALFAGKLLSVKEEVDLLKLNIVKNFTYLNKIDVAIDGISVYE